jgi:AcrR family transcriptional regulator
MPNKSSVNSASASDAKLAIMSRAARLFAERGYGSVGISEVGEEAGFGKGALYYHIKSKEDLLYDIMTLYMRDLIHAASEIETTNTSAQSRIQALSRSFMSILFSHRAEMTVCFREVHALQEKKRRSVLRLHAEYQDIWARVLHEGAKAGELRSLSIVEIKALLGMYFYSFLWIRPDGSETFDTIAQKFANIVLAAAA